MVIEYFISYAWAQLDTNKFGFGTAFLKVPGSIVNQYDITQIQNEIQKKFLDENQIVEEVTVINFIKVS